MLYSVGGSYDLAGTYTFVVSGATTKAENLANLGSGSQIPSGSVVNAWSSRVDVEGSSNTYPFFGSFIGESAQGWWDLYIGDFSDGFAGSLSELTLILDGPSA